MKKFMLEHRKKMLLCLVFALSSLIILLFNSRSSILYPDNGWVDAQAFYTVGRGWMRGLVPYRDLFEQKGPLLYLLYGLGSLIDPRGFGGIFLFEWISLSISAYWISRCCGLLIRKKLSVFVTIAAMILLTSNYSFAHGGSAEEFLFPLFFYSLYSFIAFFRGQEMRTKTLFANGLMAGLVLVTKFNLLGFWFAWMMLVFFRFCFQKKWLEGIRACFVFLGGMVLPLIGFIVYFMLAGALKEFIDGYFLFNVGSYTNASEQLSLASRFKTIYNALHSSFQERKWIVAFMLAGLVWLLLSYPLLGFCVVVLFAFTCLGVYFSGTNYHYYFLFPSLFSVFACMGGFWILDWVLRKIRVIPESVRQIIYSILLAAAFGWGLYESPNAFSETFMMPKEDRWYSKMIDYMDQYESEKVLNFRSLDSGIYNYMDQTPFMRYFMRQNVRYESYPDILDSQWEAIEQGIPDFLVCVYPTHVKDNLPSDKDEHLKDRYTKVMEILQDNGIYVLYKRNDLQPKQ